MLDLLSVFLGEEGELGVGELQGLDQGEEMVLGLGTGLV